MKPRYIKIFKTSWVYFRFCEKTIAIHPIQHYIFKNYIRSFSPLCQLSHVLQEKIFLQHHYCIRIINYGFQSISSIFLSLFVYLFRKSIWINHFLHLNIKVVWMPIHSDHFSSDASTFCVKQCSPNWSYITIYNSENDHYAALCIQHNGYFEFSDIEFVDSLNFWTTTVKRLNLVGSCLTGLMYRSNVILSYVWFCKVFWHKSYWFTERKNL